MKSSSVIAACLVVCLIVPGSEAGFRCFFGDWACKGGCVVLGNKSGICDDAGQCWCSESRISMDDLKSLLPNRCDLGEEFCRGTCNAIGRQGGRCRGLNCECSNERLSPADFALCAAESTCRMSCQAQGQGSGRCNGWSCVCEASKGGFIEEF